MSNQDAKKIAIFGSGGLLGSDLVRTAPATCRLLPYHRDTDIRNRSLLETVLYRDRPDWIINTASLSDVDECERSPEKAQELNVRAVENLRETCRALNIPIIHISTDYVFRSRLKAYSEEDIPDPLNQYGQTKWEGEQVISNWKKHYIIRTSSLYGLSRANHATRVLDALQSQTKIKLATDMICSPTFSGDLAHWLYKIVEKEPPYGIYHLCNKGVSSRFDFAHQLAEVAGFKCPYPFEPIKISSLNLPAARAERIELSTEKWEEFDGNIQTQQEGLQSFLQLQSSQV